MPVPDRAVTQSVRLYTPEKRNTTPSGILKICGIVKPEQLDSLFTGSTQELVLRDVTAMPNSESYADGLIVSNEFLATTVFSAHTVTHGLTRARVTGAPTLSEENFYLEGSFSDLDLTELATYSGVADTSRASLSVTIEGERNYFVSAHAYLPLYKSPIAA